MLRNPLYFCAFLLISSCGTNAVTTADLPVENPSIPLEKGSWRLVLDLGEEALPVNLNVRQEDGLKVDFLNADEVITAYEYLHNGDSLNIRMPLFDSELIGVITDGGKGYSGEWRNYGKGSDYSIPFTAKHGQTFRFCPKEGTPSIKGLAPRWEVNFSPEVPDDHYTAVGMFESSDKDNRITGTFMTETGDYRFLEGNICGDKFKLSCFDGSHAFLFIADWDGATLTNGVFMSGHHWKEPWTAVVSDSFELRHPDHLTTVVDSSLIWKTSMTNSSGKRVLLSELGLENKVVILQALGSWCPNCVDESRDYKDFYNRFHAKGLEIIPVTFENTEDLKQANAIIAEMRADLDLPYPVYYGGKKSKKTAHEVFPSLNHIISFPTSIFIAKDGTVRKVHTGFYGPGTKRYYEHWKHDTEMLIEQLLAEG